MSKNIVFIDSGIADYNTVIAGLEPGAKWALLDAKQDGLLQMQRALADYSDLDAIHVISHGNPGAIHLGSTMLDAGNLNLFLAPLRAIGQALSEQGDLLLYGCDVAAGETGRNFVSALALATGADVAASDNLTGAVALGGDSVLEQTNGVIETMTLPLGDLVGVLAAPASGGKLTTDFGGYESGRSITLQADGKILVAGDSNGYFALARYNANGSLDTTFDIDGKLTTDFGTPGYGTSVTVQADGKILVAGTSSDTSSGTGGNFALARYHANGSLDATFDSDGKLTTDFGGTDLGNSITVQADGKILVAGGSNSDFALARYNANGSLDTTFDTDGKLTTDFGGTDLGNSITVQADGKILVAGSSGGDFALARYNINGSLDTAFDTDGKLTTNFGSSAFGYSVTAQADGKILVAGISGSNSFDSFALARYNTNGSLDTTFDTDGKLTTNFGSSGYDASATVQADGKILVAGTSNDDFALARYNANGSLDTTFDTDGKLTSDFGGTDLGSSVTVQADGKILVAGSSISSSGKSDFALARYNANGSLDTTFLSVESTLGVTQSIIKAKIFLGAGGDIFTVNGGGTTLIANSGSDAIKLGAGVGDITTDANIERIELAGKFSDYKFGIVAGSGVQVQSATGSVICTIPSLNQNATLAFSDGAATLIQTGGAAFSLGGAALTGTGAAVAATLNAGDKSSVGTTTGVTKAKVFLGAGDNNFTVSNSGTTLIANSGVDTVKIGAGVTDIKTDANLERIELAGNLADYKFGIVAGSGVQIQSATGAVIGTIPSLNQNTTVAFTDGSAALVQTGGAAFSLGGTAIGTGAATKMTVLLNSGDKSSVPSVAGSAAIAIAAAGSTTDGGASVATTYSISSGNFTHSINGFGTGDVLKFFAGAAMTVVPDSNQTDGLQSFTLADAATGGIVTINLIGLTAAQDAGLFNMASINTVFGVDTIVVPVPVPVAPVVPPVAGSTAISVSAAGTSNAATANVTFNVAPGTFTYNITGFGPGDLLNLFAGAAVAVVPDADQADGIQNIQFADSVTGGIVTIHLTGLSAAQDAGLFNPGSINSVFGAGTISLPVTVTVPTVAGSAAIAIAGPGSSVDAGASVATTYSIAPGNFTHSITGFGPGDVLKFFAGIAGTTLVVIPDSDNTDGVQSISAGNATTGTITTITLTGLTAAQDAGLFNMASFSTVFGAGTISLPVTAQTGAGSIAIAIEAPGSSVDGGASVATTYSFAPGTFTYNITGFGVGDKIGFAAGSAPIVVNTSGTDGVIDVVGSLNNQAVTIHLTGVALASDSSVFSPSSFNTVFGAGSIF